MSDPVILSDFEFLAGQYFNIYDFKHGKYEQCKGCKSILKCLAHEQVQCTILRMMARRWLVKGDINPDSLDKVVIHYIDKDNNVIDAECVLPNYSIMSIHIFYKDIFGKGEHKWITSNHLKK